MIFLDSSPIIALLLGSEESDRSELLLGSIESGRRRAVTTPNALEEAAFKLVVAKVNETTGEKNPWKIREALKKDVKLREACAVMLQRLSAYINTLERAGLTIAEVHPEDIHRLPRFFKDTGLLTADCLHLIVMDRLGLKEIATLDSDFKTVKNVTVTL